MPEVKTIRVFDKCPHCGKPSWWQRLLGKKSVTLSQLACVPLVEKGQIAVGTLTSCRKELIPLVDPQTMALTVPILIRHWDTCGYCGGEYCIRAETTDAPIQMQPVKAGGGPGGLGQRGN